MSVKSSSVTADSWCYNCWQLLLTATGTTTRTAVATAITVPSLSSYTQKSQSQKLKQRLTFSLSLFHPFLQLRDWLNGYRWIKTVARAIMLPCICQQQNSRNEENRFFTIFPFSLLRTILRRTIMHAIVLLRKGKGGHALHQVLDEILII